MIGVHAAVTPLLADLPDAWETRRFKAVLDRLNERNEDLTYEMLSLRSTGAVVPRSLDPRQEPDTANLPKYLIAHVGDLVVNPMWLIGGGVGVATLEGAVSPDYRVFRSRRTIQPRFLHYLLRSQPYLDQYLLYTRAQTTFDRRVQQGDLDNLPLPMPPINEQRAIADYLDCETARIEALIEEQGRLIELLEERRQAVISVATGWGDPPSSWPHKRLSWLFQRTASGTTPITEDIVNAESAEIPWVTTGELREKRISSTQRGVASVTLKKYSALRLHGPGSLLVAMYGATIGRMAILDVPACSNQACCALTEPEGVISEFVQYSLLAAREWLLLEAAGGGQPNINQEILRSFRIPVPTLEEQRHIVAYLDDQTAKIDALIAETETFIELSRERRSALVTAAVTGQIDLREVT